MERLPLQDLENLIVVLVRPRNPLNIGAAARAMSNFGARRLRLVNPYGVAFREARSAVGALSVLEEAEEFSTVAEAVGDCSLVVGTTAVRDRTLHQPPRVLGEDSARIVRGTLDKGRAAILFGSEKIGLTNDDFSHCHWLMTVSTSETNISLNLGQAVAVCLYELSRNETAAAPDTEREPASSEKVEQITKGVLEALDISGYIKPGTAKMFERKTRQLILHFNLEAYDGKLLLGMVRQIVWKLKHPGKT